MDPFTQFALWSQALMIGWGYLGVFIASLLGNASIILPVPSFLAVFAAGSLLNPWLVGLAAGLGAALGELTGYALGVGGRRALKSRYEKQIRLAKKIMERYGFFPILVLFAATPLPDDVTGILAGVIRYDVRRFFLAVLIGKVVMNLGLAWAGFYGSWLLGGWHGILIAVIVFFFLAVLYYISRALADWRGGRLPRGHKRK
jgi:membrane protein YqaA with SNARE-associated domain